MAEVVIVDCKSRAETRRARTAAEESQASLDAQEAAVHFAAAAASASRQQDAGDALTQLIAAAGGSVNVRAKLKAVVAGTDTLTPAQMQRLLAAVALAEIRDRSDT